MKINIQKLKLIEMIKNKKSAGILRTIEPALLDYEICLAAVRSHGMAIRDVPQHLMTEYLVLEAIKNDRRAYFEVEFIDDTVRMNFGIEAFVEFINHYKRRDFMRVLSSPQ